MRTRPRTSTNSQSGAAKGRSPTPAYDSNALAAALLQHVDVRGTSKAFDFGVYWAIPGGYAVRGSGLLHCLPLLEAVLSAVPTCQLWYADLRKICSSIGIQRPGLLEAAPPNKKMADAASYGGEVADRIMILLSHARRIHVSSKKRAECLGSLSPQCAAQLEDFLNRIHRATTSTSNSASVSSASNSQRDMPAMAISKSLAPTPSSSVKRGLPRLASEFFPDSPKRGKKEEADLAAATSPPVDGSPPRRRLAPRFVGLFSPGYAQAFAEADVCSPVPPKKVDVRQQALDTKGEIKAAAKAKAKATAKSKSKAGLKAETAKAKSKASAKGKAQPNAVSASSSQIVYKVTLASNQSYIQVEDPVTRKKCLWVAVSKSMSTDHRNIIKHIHSQKPKTKEMALNMRAAALA